MRILIAGDDTRLLKSLVHILESQKFSVDGVDNGNDALDYALSGEYDGLVPDTEKRSRASCIPRALR